MFITIAMTIITNVNNCDINNYRNKYRNDGTTNDDNNSNDNNNNISKPKRKTTLLALYFRDLL